MSLEHSSVQQMSKQPARKEAAPIGSIRLRLHPMPGTKSPRWDAPGRSVRLTAQLWHPEFTALAFFWAPRAGREGPDSTPLDASRAEDLNITISVILTFSPLLTPLLSPTRVCNTPLLLSLDYA